jgi:PPM family protein phosphatase
MSIIDHPNLTAGGSASVRGRRSVAADATAIWGVGDHTVAAVADGVGDSDAAALAARIAVDVAMATARHVGARGAILAAQNELRAYPAAGDAVLVVAVAQPGGGWTIAWVGDCAALVYDGRVVRPLTSEHTVAAQLRALGLTVAPAWENVVTDSVRTARPDDVEERVCRPGAGPLVLLSDGVHRVLEPGEIAGIMRVAPTPAAAAHDLVQAALAAGGTDNATATVLVGR